MRSLVIHQSLLDAANPFPCAGGSVGALIANAGKQHLWEERSRNAAIDTVVIHYISAAGVDPDQPYDMHRIMEIFCTLGVSAHYLINRRGKIFALVPEEKRAWHCGGSIMPEPDNRHSVNDFSIGIELVAMADSGFCESQYRAAGMLCRQLDSRYGFLKYVGHQDVAGGRAVALGLRKEVKNDPGNRFDWKRFNDARNRGR
jgi:N-acetyl-anhydromuramyl-L-alanine amidase AmpD